MDKYFIGLLPDVHFRFLMADCSSVIAEIIEKQGLQFNSADLVAKTTMGAFFLAAMVKGDANVSLQLEGQGEIQRVLAYSDKYGKMRASALNKQVLSRKDDVTLGIGRGVFKVNRWRGSIHDRQSLTELAQESFEENLLQYIHNSEQVPSFLHINLGNHQKKPLVGGFIFQALPGANKEHIKQMQQMSKLIFEKMDSFLKEGYETSLAKLNQIIPTTIQVLHNGTPGYHCTCSMDKIKQVVKTMGKEEAQAIIRDVGKIELTCEFCVKKYCLDAEEVNLLFM